ncbi:MAG: YobA family protein [Clostridiales bacterium]|nr:YobA family protein [Clostridiales bacterium]
MKKRCLFLAAALLFLLSGCGGSSETNADYIALSGTVSSVSEHELMIDVTEGEVLTSGAVIAIFPDAIELEVSEGDVVQIWYDGEMMTSEPPQVNAVSYEILQEGAAGDESMAEPETAEESTTVQVLEEPTFAATATELTPDEAMEWELSTGVAQVLVNTAEVNGNVSISLCLDDMVVEIGEFGRLGNAYLLGLADGRSFVLLDADYASDDYVTFLFEITDGELVEQSRLEDVSLQSATVSAEQLNLRVHVDVLGSYDSYMDYVIDDAGSLQATSDFYEIPTDDSDWHLITVSNEVPVTIDGQKVTLSVGTQIRITGTDNQETAYFRVEDTGVEGSVTYVRGDGEDDAYTLYIDGISEYDYFEMLPYAG